MNQGIRGYILLALVAAIWGLAYSLSKPALVLIDPFTFLEARFILAGVVILPFIKLKEFEKRKVFQGALTGIVLYLSYIFTFIGLSIATITATGFISSLYVLWVPIISAIVARCLPNRFTLLGIILAVVGLGFVMIDRDLVLGFGELTVFAGSLCTAIYIMLVSRLTGLQNPFNFSAVQIWSITVFGIVAILFKGEINWQSLNNPTIFIAISFNGIIATAFTIILQNYAQKYVSPSHTSTILCTEPVFTALFARIINSEYVRTSVYMGGCLIVCAICLQAYSAMKLRNSLSIEN
ncbi:MAG: DMT family transporter [Eubacteriales bacterium]|nr:DMT family transporter [Eubacteriales bacterium]